MKPDAVLFVQLSHELAELGPEHAFERKRLGRDDVDLHVPGTQRSRHLEPDEARADDDRALRRLELGDDGAAVGERR
jgi:hypothetical protein